MISSSCLLRSNQSVRLMFLAIVSVLLHDHKSGETCLIYGCIVGFIMFDIWFCSAWFIVFNLTDIMLLMSCQIMFKMMVFKYKWANQKTVNKSVIDEELQIWKKHRILQCMWWFQRELTTIHWLKGFIMMLVNKAKHMSSIQVTDQNSQEITTCYFVKSSEDRIILYLW